MVADRPGDHDAAGLGQGFEAGRDIDAVAEDVAAFDDDVADVDADPKDDVPLGRQAGVARLGAALDLEPATHRLNDARELGEEAVAGLLNERAAARADRRRNDLALQRGKAPVGALLVAAHEAAVARDVGGEDGGQLALHVRDIRNPRCDATPAGAGARHARPPHAASPGTGAPALLGDRLARAAELGREILQLRQPVAHRQHGLGVVDVNAGSEGESRDRRREHVDEPERGCRFIRCPPHFAQY